MVAARGEPHRVGGFAQEREAAGVRPRHVLQHRACDRGVAADIVITAGYGALTFYIQEQVSQTDTNLQRRYAVTPVFWHLTDAQKTTLARALDAVPKEKRFSISIQCLPDAGSRAFVEEFAGILQDHDWKYSANCLFSNLKPEFTGLAVGITPSIQAKIINKPEDQWPSELGNLRTLVDILKTTEIPGQWGIFDDKSKQDHFYLLIGNAPKNPI